MMDKATIVEYIEESPQNTNRAILNQMLDEFADTNGGGGANWDQNDPTAKDYVKNRTHYKENKTYLIADNFETTYSERQGEGEIARFLVPNNFPFNLLIENMEPTSLKVFVNGEPIKVVNYNEFGAIKEWHLENDLTITYYYYMPKGEPSELQFSWRVVPDVNFEAVNGQKFNLTVTIDDVIYVPIDEKYMPKSVLEWQQPVDWNCNDVNDPTYIKNRTHYDYWDKGNIIYGYNGFENVGTLPYTFQVTKEGDGWLGGHGFMYNDCPFNSDSNWEKIGEEYDETLEIWKTKYKCQQTQNRYGHEETLTINATTYSQYISEKDEWGRFVTIDCEYEGDSAIELYEAEVCSKTLDKRFLADFSVEKDWNINDSTNPRYIKNRTHYSYIGQGEGLLFDAYESEMYEEYNYLPYTQIIQSDLIETNCPGYWLGKEAGYWINIGDPHNPDSYLLDAYSDWKKVGEEDNIIIYQCQHESDIDFPCTLTVAVQPVEGSSNEYEVELRSATYQGEGHYGVRTAKKMYKTLDAEYLPDGLPKDIDWNENNETSRSYIRNRPCYIVPEVLGAPVFDQTVEAAGRVADAPHEHWNGLYKVTINDTDIQYVQAKYRRADMYNEEYFIKTDYFKCTHSLWHETGNDYNNSYSMYINDNAPVPCKITIQKVNRKYELIQLDEKFIPNEIARVSQIEEAASEIASEINGLQWSDFGEYYKPSEVVVGEKHEDEYHGVWFEGKPIKGLDGTSLENGDVVTININMFDSTYSFDVTVDNYEMSVSISGYAAITIDITYDPEANEYYIRNRNNEEPLPNTKIKITKKENREYYPLKDEYIPDTIARAPKVVLEDVTEAPTAEQYNALLAILRQAGILAT